MPSRLTGGLLCVCMLAVSAVFTIGALRYASWPMDGLSVNVVIDDAFYYLVPARHLLDGQGYTFDGEHRASGVQPLWAAVCIALTAVVRDPELLLRALVLLSGACWAAAGLLLFWRLGRVAPAWATIAATLWLLTAFWYRLGFQGMENGLHALTFVAVLVLAVRPTRSGATRDVVGWALGLGLALALFTLTRPDGGILAVLLGVLVLLRVLPVNDPAGSYRRAFRLAVLVAIPGVILVGACCALFWWYFGTALPLSGTVKLFYQSQRTTPQFDSFAAALGWHLGFIRDMATWTLHTVPRRILAMVVVVGLLRMAVHIWFVARRRNLHPARLAVFAVAVLVFALVRLGMFATLLPMFTMYGNWYFAPETLLFVLVIAAGIAGVLRLVADIVSLPLGRRRAAGAQAIVAVGAAVAAIAVTVRQYDPTMLTTRPRHGHNCFYTGARWLDAYLPAGARIAANSAGVLAYFASRHTVVNTDGLMNDREFFEEYLKPGRVPEYLNQERIGYFADYSTPPDWKWRHQLGHDVLLRWWPLPDTDPLAQGFPSFAVWKRPPAGEGAPPADAFERIAFEAAILKKYPLVPDGAERPAGRIVTSLVRGGELLHVIVPPDVAAKLRVADDQFYPGQRLDTEFGGAWRLAGFSLYETTWTRRQPNRFGWYWRRRREEVAEPTLQLHLGLARPSSDGPAVVTPILASDGCHGSWPLAEWPLGSVVAETLLVTPPAKLPAGSYALVATVGPATMSPDAANHSEGHVPVGTWVFLENIELR